MIMALMEELFGSGVRTTAERAQQTYLAQAQAKNGTYDMDRQHLASWLQIQAHRVFDILDTRGCVLASYLTSVTGKPVEVRIDAVRIDGRIFALPLWASLLQVRLLQWLPWWRGKGILAMLHALPTDEALLARELYAHGLITVGELHRRAALNTAAAAADDDASVEPHGTVPRREGSVVSGAFYDRIADGIPQRERESLVFDEPLPPGRSVQVRFLRREERRLTT